MAAGDLLEALLNAARQWRAAADAVADRPHRRLTGRVIPVSYTHLRAHETVLDLVCRLLLEKKKKCTSTAATTCHTHYTRVYDA